MPSLNRTLLALASLALAGTAYAAKIEVLGPTYPIVEVDTSQELRQKAAAIDWKKYMMRDPKTWSAFQSVSLPKATADASRLFDPTYHIPRAIYGPDGKVLYPKGYAVNVYSTIHIPGRYIVVDGSKAEYEWLDKVAKPTEHDKILLAGGNVLQQRVQTHRKLFLLDDRFIERFGLQRVPAIVQQEGTMLRVTEFFVPEKE